MREQTITIAGRLTGDPEVRFTPSGTAVANFTIAYTPSKYDKTTSQWQDGETQWWRCQAWNAGKLTLAENIGNVFKKGDGVIAHGVLEARTYETREGEKRTVTELRVQHIGKDALYHGQPYAQQASPPTQQQSGGWGGSPAADQAWGVNPAADTEPPF